MENNVSFTIEDRSESSDEAPITVRSEPYKEVVPKSIVIETIFIKDEINNGSYI